MKDGYDDVINQILKLTEGDIKKAFVVCKNIISSSRSNAHSTNAPKRFITAKELEVILGYILDGECYHKSIQKASIVLNETYITIDEVCNTIHNKSILNKTFRIAEKPLRRKIENLIRGGYIEKSDYRSKVKPKTSLNRILKAVKLRNTYEKACANYRKDENNSKINEKTLDRVSNSAKIRQLLSQGFSRKHIITTIGCSTQQISNEIRRMRKHDNEK